VNIWYIESRQKSLQLQLREIEIDAPSALRADRTDKADHQPPGPPAATSIFAGMSLGGGKKKNTAASFFF
jgi:hypothetical protein